MLARLPSVPIRRHLLIARAFHSPFLPFPPSVSLFLPFSPFFLSISSRTTATGVSPAGVLRSETHYNYLRRGPRASTTAASSSPVRGPEKFREARGLSRWNRRKSPGSRGKKAANRGGSDSRNESEIAARLIKSELHSTGVYTPTGVRWGSTSITASTIGRM